MHLLKPPRLHHGDTVGIIAPSFPLLPAWRADYERGKDMLRALGFSVKEGRTLGLCRYWAAVTPQDQADEIIASPSWQTSILATRSPTFLYPSASTPCSTPRPHP